MSAQTEIMWVRIPIMLLHSVIIFGEFPPKWRNSKDFCNKIEPLVDIMIF